MDRLFQHLNTADIHEWNPVEADDQCLRIRPYLQQRTPDVLDGAEEHRTGDLVDLHIGWQCRQAERRQFRLEGRSTRGLGIDRFRHSADELQYRENDSDVDRDDQVGKHRQKKCDQQDPTVGRGRGAHHTAESPDVTHVPGNDEENRSQRRERNAGRQWRQDQKYRDESCRMNEAGEGAGGTVAYVGGRACDGPGCSEPAEQRCHDVGDPLPDQLLVGVVAGAGHPVGYDGRQKRLDCSQQGDGERRPEQRHDMRGRQVRHTERRQASGNAAEGGA